jgi:hypothetical protein
MKETGTARWLSPTTGATNSSAFTGLPGGHCYGFGTYIGIGVGGNWWISTEFDNAVARERILFNEYGVVGGNLQTKSSGFSVRCLTD